MAALNETRNATINDASMASQGLLLKYHASGVMKTAAVGDDPIGVTAAESSKDAAGAYEAATVGTVAVYPLTGLVYIKCVAKSGMKFGMPLYVSQTGSADGYVEQLDSNSAGLVGYYYGENKDIAAGDLVPVMCGRWA